MENLCEDLVLIKKVEQFYFREARLLDNREYQQWLELLSPEIQYNLPNRHNPQLDPSLRETEKVLNVVQELSSGLEPNLRSDNFLTLSIRASRSFKLNAWTENPPARTRRFVSNVEVYQDDSDVLKTYSNVMLSYSRHEQDNHQFSYQRCDLLNINNNELKISHRDVVLDWQLITGPSTGLLF